MNSKLLNNYVEISSMFFYINLGSLRNIQTFLKSFGNVIYDISTGTLKIYLETEENNRFIYQYDSNVCKVKTDHFDKNKTPLSASAIFADNGGIVSVSIQIDKNVFEYDAQQKQVKIIIYDNNKKKVRGNKNAEIEKAVERLEKFILED